MVGLVEAQVVLVVRALALRALAARVGLPLAVAVVVPGVLAGMLLLLVPPILVVAGVAGLLALVALVAPGIV